MAARLVPSPIVPKGLTVPHAERASMAQDEHHGKRSQVTVGPQSVERALLQENVSLRKPWMGAYPKCISSRAQTFDSGYASNESLAKPTSTVGSITKRSSLRSVYTADIGEIIDSSDSSQHAAGQHQPLHDQRKPSTAQFSNHRMLLSLEWLLQHPAWPFPKDEDFVFLAASAQLNVQQISSWFLWSQQRLLHHANSYLDALPEVEESDCELERGSVFINAPSSFRTQYPSTRTKNFNPRPRLGRTWNSDWLHVQRQKLKQIRILSSIPSLVYTTHTIQRPMYSIATILNSTAALTLGLSVPREQSSLQSETHSSRSQSVIGKDVGPHRKGPSGDVPPGLQESQYPTLRPQKDSTCKDNALNAEAGDYSSSVDRWLADLVACNLEEIRASLKHWHAPSDPDQIPENILGGSTIDVLPSDGPIRSDETDETDFHSLKIGKQSPSYLVGACNAGHQNDNAQTHPTSPSTISEELHESSQSKSIVSDSTSFISEAEDSIAQIGLWKEELEMFVIWARTYVLPSIVQSFHGRTESSLNSDSSVRSCATGETSQNNSNGQVENASFPSPGDYNNGNKRKRRGSDDGNRPPKGSLRKARARPPGSAEPRRNFACHYHKHDRWLYSNLGHTRYKSCSHGFDAIHRLKEHLNRVHKPEDYCFRCKTIFKEQIEKSQHDTNPVRCEERCSPDFDAMIITVERKKALQRRAPDARTEEEEWYKMWDHLFVSHQRPRSPYQDVPPEVVEFRERAERRLSGFVRDFRLQNLTLSIPDTVLTEIYRIAIEYLTDEAVPQIRAQIRAMPETLAPEAAAVRREERLHVIPNMTGHLTGGPWHANVPQTPGAHPHQAISDIDSVFRQRTPTVTQLPPAATQMDLFAQDNLWHPNSVYNGDILIQVPMQGDSAETFFVSPVNSFINGTRQQHFNPQ